MGLFDVVYRGSDEMYFKAEAAVKETIEKLGENAPVAFANTAFNLSCILAYTGLKVTTMAELRDALVPIRAMMTRGWAHRRRLPLRRRHRYGRRSHRGLQVRREPQALRRR